MAKFTSGFISAPAAAVVGSLDSPGQPALRSAEPKGEIAMQTTPTLKVFESAATGILRQHRGQVTANLYSPRGETKMTPERAYATMLEENPAAYEAYRREHNARGIVSTLEAAGIRLSR